MVGSIDIKINSQFPNMPLKPVWSFKDSPSNFRIFNLPEKVGSWEINKVYLQAGYPDNSIKTVECVKSKIDSHFGFGGTSVWVGTIDGCSTIGKSSSGFTVFADGLDENGNDVQGYVLGKADLYIMDNSPFIQPSTTSYQVRYFESQPSNPNIGDCYLSNRVLNIWNGNSWISTGSNITKVSQLENDANYQNATQVQSAINNAGFLTSLNYATVEKDFANQNYLDNNAVNAIYLPIGVDNQNRNWERKYIDEANISAPQDYCYLCSNGTLYVCNNGMGLWQLYEYQYDDETEEYEWVEIDSADSTSLTDTQIVFESSNLTLNITHSFIGNLVFPDFENGKARDFLFYLETDVDEISVFFSNAESDDTPITYLSNDDDVFVFETGKTIMAFSEISPHTFLVNKQKLNVVSQQGG